MMNRSEPFLFLFYFMIRPNVLCLFSFNLFFLVLSYRRLIS